MRGETYLALRHGDKAASEFQKRLAHPGLVWNSRHDPSTLRCMSSTPVYSAAFIAT